MELVEKKTDLWEQIEKTYSSKRTLNAAVLKWIAIITMFIDHIGAGFVICYLKYFNRISAQTVHTKKEYELYLETFMRIRDFNYVLRSIGRIAFPLFCFMLVTGFYYTRSRFRYLGRLILFGVISEIPYNLAFSQKWIDTESTNVYVTLVLGLLAIILVQFVLDHVNQVALRYPLSLLAMVGCILLAELLKTDYKGPGVALILVFYLFYTMPVLRDFSFAAVILYMIMRGGSSPIEAFALIDILLIHLYNGKKGKNLPKMFFYLFYPVHLLLIAISELIAFGW